MSISAMKQALEALTYIYTETTEYEEKVMDEAITVLEQAIEQAEKVVYVDSSRFPKDSPEYKPGMAIKRSVHASDMSEKHVHESDKHRHEPAPWEGIREIVELRGSHSEEYEEGFWAGLQAYEDKLKEQDWYGQWQWQCGYERGWDAAMENRHEFECPRCGHCCRDGLERLCRIMGTFDLATGHADTIDEALDALEAELRDVLGHLRARREWVGLTDEDMEVLFLNEDGIRFARYIEAKLKEKNT